MSLALRKIEPLVSIYDLEALPNDDNIYELFEGELFVSKAPALKHQELIGRMYNILTRYLEQNPIGSVWITPGVIFNEYNSAIPDLVFILKERVEQIASGIHIVGAPDLAIEIMSPGSENARRDHIIKRQTYGKFGVKEYWIVEPISETLDVSRLNNGILASLGIFRNGDEITSELLPNLSFRVSDVFRR